jgi:small-conductance mechanosensitive channel
MLAGLCLLLVLVGIGLWYTSTSDQTTTLSRRRNRTQGEQQVWMSQRSLDTARQFAKWSNNTRDEDRLAREAVQLADDELDLAYTTALRESQLNPAPASQKTKELRAYVRQLTDAIKAGNDRVIKLSSAINSAKSSDVDALQQQLDLAEAQITLNSQELEDAKQDLLRTSDDVESRIQRLITAHKSSFHNTTETQQAQPPRLPTFSVPENLSEQVELLGSMRSKRKQLAAAQQSAVSSADNIDKQHDQLEKTLGTAASPNQSGATATHQDQIAALERLSQERKLLSDYDQRQQDQQQLAQVYGNWVGLLQARQLAVIHGILKSVLLIILVVILIVLAEAAMERYLVRLKTERRRLLTIRMVSRFAVRVICFLLVLLVIFGPPSQISTIIGLITAGLTVALKDFIIAFLGWFVLMGRNGIRVGDWVEINGISGEVVEIGLLRTVLLETGNWADSGHPTGRRVTFVNSFAIERHYFNFSTAGQWLWDTLEIMIPAGKDPHPIIEEIKKMVTESTAESVRLAEQEWQRVTHKYGVQTFSATPSIDVRPTGAGVIVNVRYITRAQERYEVRSKLYESVVELLHGQKHSVASSN